METKSPFSIPEESLQGLGTNEGFRIVQAFLAKEQNYPFCPSHTLLSTEMQTSFTLHRDILHSLLLPILQIRSQAALYANHLLSSQSSTRPVYPNSRSPSPPRPMVDLEVAFRGNARGAFSWLQCFIAEERDWCSTKGCPACTVLKVLHAEPFIRIVVAACRLTRYLKDLSAAEAPYSAASGGSSFPDFDFWLTAVRHAVSEDDFWGLHFWEDIEARAEDLESGIKDLISQCTSMPDGPSATAGAGSRTVSTGSITWAQGVKNGKMVKRQMILKEEEQRWMEMIIDACRNTLLTEAARARRKVSVTREPIVPRVRSMTT